MEKSINAKTIITYYSDGSSSVSHEKVDETTGRFKEGRGISFPDRPKRLNFFYHQMVAACKGMVSNPNDVIA